MKIKRLTKPDGSHIWVNLAHIGHMWRFELDEVTVTGLRLVGLEAGIHVVREHPENIIA